MSEPAYVPANELRYDEAGELDDLVIVKPDMVRLERMDEGAWWLAVYLPDGERLVVRLAAKRPGRTRISATATEVPKGLPIDGVPRGQPADKSVP